MARATVELIYVSFGFKLMRREFSSDRAWRDFVTAHFPEEVRNRNTYVAIGEHFKYDDSYLTFLTGASYAVPPKEVEQKRNVGNQLDDLNKRLKSEQKSPIRCPADLIDWIKNKDLPEVPSGNDPQPSSPADKTSQTEATPSGLVVPISGDPDGLDTLVLREEPISDSSAALRESNGDDYEEALDHVILRLSVLGKAKKALRAILDRCPVSELNQDKVALLMASLRNAEEMREMLG